MSTTAVTTAAAPSSNLKGIGLYLIAFAMFAVMDTSAKYLLQYVPPIEMTWFRYVVHLAILLLVMKPWRSLDALRTNRPWMQLIRSLIMAVTTFLMFSAVQLLDLATYAAILISTPLVITALAGPLLGDWAGPRRWAAVLVGFVGVLIVTWPGADGFEPAALIAIAAAVVYAGYALMTRYLTATETNFGLLFYSAVIPSILVTPAVIPVWVTPDWPVLAALLLFGGFAALSHMVYIMAFRHAPATVLAPFQYSQAIWLPIFGFLIFDTVPEANTLIGGAIVVASGLYVLNRERMQARTERTAGPKTS